MNRWQGKVAIVTGASSGIGASIVDNLVNHDLKVVGLSRRQEILDVLAEKYKEKCFHGIKTDLTIEEDILNAFTWIKENLGPISILINNAGILKPTRLIDGSTNDFKSIIDTNFLALTITTREAVQNMIAHGIDGHIIHINSISGHYVPQVPNLNVYPATKHAVTALTETLRQELNSIESKIKITSISPGLVDTDIFIANGYQLESKSTMPILNPKDVADAVTFTLGTPPHVQISELTIRPVGEMF